MSSPSGDGTYTGAKNLALGAEPSPEQLETYCRHLARACAELATPKEVPAMADALSKAIKKEETRQKRAAITRVRDRAFEGELIGKASSAAGVVAAAIHDKLRGEGEDVAKFGPVPANLAVGLGAVGVGLIVPQSMSAVRNVVGGAGMGMALAGLYRLTLDNWPESDE